MKKILGLLAILLFVGPAQAYQAPPTLSAFNPTGYATLAATSTTSRVALATNLASTPMATTVVVLNQGAGVVYVSLGSVTVTATATTSYPIPVGQSITLVIGSATYLAAISASTSTVNIITGY